MDVPLLSRCLRGFVVALASALFVLTTFANGLPQSALVQFELPEAWELPISWVSLINPSLSLAVCPNGSVYDVDVHGKVELIGADGQAQQYGSVDPMYRGAMACDIRQRLYMAGQKLTILEPRDRSLHEVSSAQLRSRVSNILVTPSGSIFGISKDYSSSAETLYLLSANSKILWADRGGLSGSYPFETVVPPQGILVWDRSSNRLLCLLPGSKRIQSFDGEGKHPETGSSAVVGPSSMFGGTGLMSVTSLADGRLAVQVLTGRDFVGRSVASIEIADSSLRVISPAIRAGDFGFLLGSTPDEGLYFVTSREAGAFRLVKRKIVYPTLVQ